MSGEGSIQGDLASGVDGFGLAIMHLVGCHQAEAYMVMRLIIPREERAAECFGVLDAAEGFRECRLILKRFEVAFRERIVVADVRPAVRFCDAQVGEKEGGCFGFHRAAAIGVQGKLARWHIVLLNGVVE